MRTTTVRIVSLRKRKQRYVFRYSADHTPLVFEAMARLAADPDEDFDFHDAAVLAFWMGRLLEYDPEPSVSDAAAGI